MGSGKIGLRLVLRGWGGRQRLTGKDCWMTRTHQQRQSTQHISQTEHFRNTPPPRAMVPNRAKRSVN
ncbi:hypothetical protein MPTK1_3g21810 [Marchantia polymorpha subsp. ruderalis]|uniref:Uncharacterized protein n=2 Tax=Marchantia polymorpha TaxID=3197 RepID=A0AAF6B3D1_MARPO|nr:hypothetical protein MARPO_0089s0035 [Marchantia polymorpha]BBN06515.1 hypothetical protein Mp_3g21810 [Marchantia polymorpha subsp. ruderalis]|eukprot:PTQ33403.1 hypothetical protein MARPO_0089s0035 [Marchantia polymorpha]